VEEVSEIASERLTCGGVLTTCLDLARVHGEHEAWTPVLETLVDTTLHRFDYFAGESPEFFSS
jgi:hypothetical protein